MKRTAIILVWLASLLLAYHAGRSDRRSPGAQQPAAAQQPARAQPPANAAGDPAQEPGHATDALADAEALIAQGRPRDALDVISGYLAATDSTASERYARALFLLSDIRQMTGEVQAALAPLFDILRYPPSPATADRARNRLQLLINAREQQLINAGDLAGLVAYFEALLLAEPGYDGHRLKLSRWLLRAGRVDEAARLLREMGLEGVTAQEVEALAAEIELAGTALPVEREGGAMYTSASVGVSGRQAELRFLIDTGATMTGLAESRLRSLGAARIGERIRVQTANGVVELPIYRLDVLRLGALELTDLAVLGFADLPRGADGLLGMDVLDRLSGSPARAVGRPGKAR